MASSDEEGEIVAELVTNYYFVDSRGEPIPFSSLPLEWNDNESVRYSERDLKSTELAFMRGIDGRREIYRQVIAWKFELSYVLPEIYVLVEGKYETWIKLQRPRKSYENTVRTVLISVHCLHFMKKNSQEESAEALWKHIRRAFSTYEVPPSESDLVDHMQWIKETVLRDKDIAKSKILPTFLSEMSGKRKAFYEANRAEKKPKFIVDKDDSNIDDHDDGSDADKDELFDRVCAFCDDGGELLGCEGRCIRSFHPTIESGTGSFCESLCYSSEQVDAIQTFLCKNCQYQQHQCFICGRLGSSDKSSGTENPMEKTLFLYLVVRKLTEVASLRFAFLSFKVFPCVSATCGHFYHPHCVSKRVFPGDDYQAQELRKQIEVGDSFTCPAHKCFVCKQGEDRNVPHMEFAICRRCPKAYHHKCLPRNISFQRNDAENIPQRAWEGLLTNRILIYCTDHKICRKILTPKRDHLLFPDVDGTKEQYPTESLPDKLNATSGKRSKAYGILTEIDKVKVEKLSRGITGDFRRGDSINRNEKSFAGKTFKQNLSSSMFSKNVASSECIKPNKPPTMEKSKLPWKHGESVSMLAMKRTSEKAVVQKNPAGSARPSRTVEMEKRIQKLMKDSISSINVVEFLNEQRRKCSHASSPHFRVDKTITMGKVECSVKATQTALKTLQEGGTVEDAKAVCEPAILTQMIKWKKKLGVYLAPFIHGMRYTSFGRHFTKVDKLKQIKLTSTGSNLQVVNRLHCYVQDGDTIVDFCCGSNDFSCLMKEELDRMGKKCFFKNYDLIQPKNDFNFEKRDWMSVCLEDLPEGSKLIMGLNPPFGVQAFHANQFIEKALKFNPKLLILIVPKETESLDRKKIPYDLIWEDDKIFSGKSFYLPGSVDVHEQQMEQWNLDAPPLYLWSRPDWTTKHKAIAVEHRHIIKNRDTEYSGGISPNAVSNYLMEENQDCYGDFSDIADGYGDINCILEDLPEVSD
ncbi:hypothetical protein BUALT_Bualt03G0231000 [Buddleja alternifolia]|uniref:Zinc finger PHD-type domain-containing protein n=1 Tax=Buddleja alternifolia TaxID=168488 RepID=A0AAV6XWU0_9LAMI|nr:hypothetical protein BUALT_Bualt03G0231000 [Buddleja alternifolia]